ncbi:1,4-dihydroxy-2-naphthoate polyprenyltransferase [candidate division GN15 bacterium]|nr:1,4-dihydroxy-2-naphthoate polyprenyltransferase [candidate division GN15 bacterium]
MADEQPGSIAVWVLAARPKTLWAAMAPVFMGTAMAAVDGTFQLWAALAALAGAMLIQIGTNYANDYYDYTKGADEGERLGPLRVTQAGLVSPSAMRTATAIVFGAAFVIGIYLVVRGGWPIVVIGLLSILFGILYTAGPYPLGYNGLGEIFVLVFFGPVAVGGTYYVQALTIDATVLIAGLSPGLFSVAILAVNNLRDIDSDRRANKRTLAARFGRTFGRMEYVLAVVIGSLIPTALCIAHKASIWVLLTLVVPLIAIPTFRTVCATVDGPRLNNVLATTGKLLLLFAVLFSVGWMI